MTNAGYWRQRQVPGPKGLDGNDDHRHARYDSAMASKTGGREMGPQREAEEVGRPRIRQVIVDLILRFAKENPSWGYDRIQGALANVGYHISDQTVGNILKQHGIEPAPDRKRQTTWKTFIKSHWDVLAAIDFTTIEVWTKGGLVTFYLLFVMEVATRRVHFAGCTASPMSSG